VDQLVARLDIDAASDEEVATLAGRIAAMGRQAVAWLARGLFRPGPAPREKVAALLGCVRGEHAAWALAEVQKLLESGKPGPMERVSLLTTARRLEEAASSETAGDETPSDELPAGPLVDEMQMLLWRDELASLPPAEQEAVLAPMLHDGDPQLLPLLEMALSLGQPRLDAAIASGLAHFPSPAALPLLRELLRRPGPDVRRRARKTLVALERQGVDVSQIFVAATEANDPIAASLATPPDRGGQMAVLVARGREPDPVRYALVMLDPIEAGISRAWGESGLTETDLSERIDQLSEQIRVELDPIDLNVAQALVAAGEEFARARGRALPADYLVWRRIIGRPKGPAQLPVVFGPACSECASGLRTADIERGGLVAGRLALCGKCAERPRGCAVCGRPLHHLFDDFEVRRGRRKGRVEFVCLACARSRHKRGGRR